MITLITQYYREVQWDIDCLIRLLNSVKNRTLLCEKVYVIDNFNPLDYLVDFLFIEHIKLEENRGPVKGNGM